MTGRARSLKPSMTSPSCSLPLDDDQTQVLDPPRDESPLVPGALVIEPVSVERSLGSEMRREWNALVAASPNVYAQYASPDWIEHLQHVDGKDLLPPITVRGARGELVGVVPLMAGSYDLAFTVRDRVLLRSRVRAITVLGSQPLLPQEPAIHDRVLAAVLASAPDAECIYLHSVPTDSFFWQHIQQSPWMREQLLTYLPFGLRPFHLLELPATFEDFLSRFRAKRKYNLARQVRLLRDHLGGNLRFERIDGLEHVARFAAAAQSVVQRSWQRHLTLPETSRGMQHPRRLEDLARRGLLRSYVLYADQTPCALVLGYQFEGIFHYAEIAYDQSFRRFSPGTVLLYLLIEDLIAHRPPRMVNFGIGDAEYKRGFSNVHREDALVLLFRRRFANLVRCRSHATFRAIVRSAKRSLESGYVKKTDA